MLKLSKPAAAGVAFAMSIFLGAFALASRAEALAVLIFNPPKQQEPSEQRLAAIADYDVIVFIDSSKSMGKSLTGERNWSAAEANLPSDVSPTESRWQWCSEQTDILNKQLQKSLKVKEGDHVRVVLFNDRWKEFKDVDMSSVPAFFAHNTPSGNTNAVAALKSQLKSYFAARDRQEKVKPLLVAMITDGCPDSPWELRQTIVDATRRMKDANEIAITFLQVGTDKNATQYLRDLDHDLGRWRAKYDIVTSKTFDQVNKSGLALALLDAVHR